MSRSRKKKRPGLVRAFSWAAARNRYEDVTAAPPLNDFPGNPSAPQRAWKRAGRQCFAQSPDHDLLVGATHHRITGLALERSGERRQVGWCADRTELFRCVRIGVDDHLEVIRCHLA